MENTEFGKKTKMEKIKIHIIGSYLHVAAITKSHDSCRYFTKSLPHKGRDYGS